MHQRVTRYIRTKQIDSFQKLRFLLFLYQHPEVKGTIQEFSQRLYLGDILLLTDIISELQRTGLVACSEDRYALPDQSEIRSNLRHLTEAFEDPVTRQELLDQVKTGFPLPEQLETGTGLNGLVSG